MKGTSLAPSAVGLLGLARRAGAVAPGIEAVRRAIQTGQARLVLTAEDASRVQLDKIRKAMRDRAIPQVTLGDRDALGASVGTAPLAAVAITNGSFADRIRAELEGSTNEGSQEDVEA